MLSKFRVITAAAALGLGTVGLMSATAQPQAPADAWASKRLTERFTETQKLIQPQAGESRWREIPWQTSLWEARRLAAAAGKPMFVWSGSGGAPCAPT